MARRLRPRRALAAPTALTLTATISGSHVTVTNAYYNGTVRPGTTTEPYSFWSVASGPGTPANCRINGNRCDGGPDRAPGAPTGLTVTGRTTKTVSLSWTAATATEVPIAGYDVLTGGTGGTVATSVTGTTATVTGLTPNTAYTFTVRARDTYDNASAASNAVTVTTDDVVGAGKYAKVGYFVQWGVYGRQYIVKNLDTTGAATELTHVNYAFTNLDPVNLTCLNGVVLGVSTNPDYGRGWQGVTDGGAHGEWQAANSAAPGQFAGEAGTRGHSNLIASVPGCTVYHDTQAVATYCYTGNGGRWWTFDGTRSIGQKTTWLRTKGLLGAMIWEMSGDTGTLMSAVDTGLR